MQKIGDSTSTANAAGEYTEGNAGAGVDATLIKAQWLNTIQRELVALVEGGGLVLDPATDDQVLTALRNLVRESASAYALDTGSATAYVATFTPPITALTDGMVVRIKAKTANTAACTFKPNALAAKAIVGSAHGALQGGEIVASGDVWLQYNSSIGGGSWVLIGSTGGALPVGVGSKSLHALQAAQVQAGVGLYGADTAAGNVYAVAYAPVITALTDGMQLRFKAKTANTGASTFAPNGLAAKAIVGLALAPLQGGEIVVDGMCSVVYSLAQDKWVLTSCSGGDLQVAPASQSQHAVQAARVGTAGGLGRRNILINALGKIKARPYASGEVTTIANQYTVDRWYVNVSGQALSWVDSGGVRTFTAPAGGVTQAVKADNVLGGPYVLSFEGTAVATVNGVAVVDGGAVTLPANTIARVKFSSGTFSVPQLEPGSVPTVFDFQNNESEELICQKYFYRPNLSWLIAGYATAAGQRIPDAFITYPKMIGNPVAVVSSGAGVNVVVGGVSAISTGLTQTATAVTSGPSSYSFGVTSLDAEFV